MVDFAVVQKSSNGVSWQDQLIENRDIAMVSGKDELRQYLMIRLKFIFGEWFLDTTKGVKYYEEVFIKNPDIATIDREFKRTILKTDGITELIEFKSSYNRSERKYYLAFKANSNYGELIFDNTLLIGVQ